MDICGHCGGMDRHFEGCKPIGFPPTDAEAQASELVSSHDPQRPASTSTGSCLLMPLTLGLITVFALVLAVILKWP